MYEKNAVISNQLGLHSRASALIVAIAHRYHSETLISYEGRVVSGKNLMAVMMLCVCQGSEITVQANGVDEVEVVEAIVAVINAKMNEE